MLYSVENMEDLGNSYKLVSLNNRVVELRLQHKLDKQNYEVIRKLHEQLTYKIKNTSENLIKSLKEGFIKNNIALKILNEKVSELLNDKGMIAPCLDSYLVIHDSSSFSFLSS